MVKLLAIIVGFLGQNCLLPTSLWMGISYVYVKIDIQFHLPRFGRTKIDEWRVWVLNSLSHCIDGSKIVESIWTF